jgi:hypothetical protein
MVGPALVLLLAQAPASACASAAESEFGVAKEQSIQVGGGAMYAAARERRYLDALRGPMGETVQYRRTGSLPLDPDGRTILDRYEITYSGLEKPITIFLDAYHFDDALKAPKGFTCAVPFGLNPPGPDPMLASESLFALAVTQGGKQAFAPIPLDADGSAAHGVIYDRFRLVALAARAAAAAGAPLDPEHPSRDVTRAGMLIVGYPLKCEGPGTPINIEQVASDGSAVRAASERLVEKTLAPLLPGMSVPAGTAGVVFPLERPRPGDSVRITYGANSCQSEIQLPLKYTSAKATNTPMPALPAGHAPTDQPVRLQALLDADGAPQHIVYTGGPRTLSDAAVAAVRAWTAEPMRLNGAPMVTPITFQVKFGSR